jgi:erythromycin esterase
MRTLALVALAACSAPPAPAARTTPPPPVVPNPMPDVLNLGFEDVDGTLPKGWPAPATAGYEVTAVADGHNGHGLALRATAADSKFGASLREVPLPLVRGKRVRLHAWVKTDGVAHGFAGVMLRADGEDQAFDNMADRGVTGTTPWHEIWAEIVVPETATGVIMGPLLVGDGSAVFDDLRLEVADAPKPHVIHLDGQVVDAAGAPVAGAEVALIAGGVIAERTQSDPGGAFHFTPMSGTWAVSAQHAGAVAAFRDEAPFDADAKVPLALGKAGTGVVVAGKVTGIVPKYVMVAPGSDHNGDLFVVASRADGTFEAELPDGDGYRVEAIDAGIGRISVPHAPGGKRVEVTLANPADVPPPDAVVAWIGAHAAPLASADPAAALDDLAPLHAMVAKARIVALGEATHGTREFFQLKHRVLEYMVAKEGATLFAIEANQPEARAINDYVLHGTGDAKTALRGIYFWTWNTEEVLALIEWLRAWNADPAHKQKVQFAGFDMQTSEVAYKNVADYVKDPALLAPIEALGHASAPQDVKVMSNEARAKLTAGLAALAKALAKAPDDIRHDATILAQAAAMYGEPTPFDARDRAMAENVGWLLDHQPKGARIVVWAHNGHISNTLPTFKNMGSQLRAKYKAAYVNLGFVFAQGGFQAMVGMPPNLKLKAITVGPPRPSDTSVAFVRTTKPLLLLDLHTVPKTGPVHDWFVTKHPTREIGALFAGEREMESPMALPELFDGVIFVASTTRARPVQ